MRLKKLFFLFLVVISRPAPAGNTPSVSLLSNNITDGYTDRISYNPGDTVKVFINASATFTNYKVYVNNVVLSRVDSLIVNIAPQAIVNLQPWTNGFGYSQSFTYVIPGTLPSGLYNFGNKIFFVIKSAAKNADITIVFPSNTEAAYNQAGGKNTYDALSSSNQRAKIVSFLRPLSNYIMTDSRSYCDRFLKWIATVPGYSMQMIADIDMDNYAEIQNSKIIVIVGHSEYWTRQARLNFDQFVNNGKDAIVLSGNTMGWQVRYSSDKKQLICYKDSVLDPEPNLLLKSVEWTQVSLHYSVLKSIGVDWPHGAYGMKPYHGWYGYKILLPNSPLLQGTGLNFHSIVSCQSVEYDATLFSGFTVANDPIIDSTSLGFCKIELIGYDLGKSIYSHGPQKSYGTFVAFKKTISSGNVINTGFTNWCARNGGPGYGTGSFGGPDSNLIKQITLNMFNKLLAHQNIYAYPNSCVTGTEELIRMDDLLVFPNPGTGEYHVLADFSNYDKIALNIYNLSGQFVLSKKMEPVKENIFDISDLDNGIYIYTVNDGKRIVNRGKIVLIH